MKVSKCSKRPILVPCDLEYFNYQIDPYVGCEHYCYYCYALNQAETDWTKEICISNNIEEQLEAELSAISPQEIYLGYYTDPYQPCEVEYRQTRKVLELLSNKGFTANILTKSDLVIRDIDVLQEMSDSFVSVSVAFNDNQTRRLFEANTMNTEARIDALSQLKKVDIDTGALICPVVPFITDVHLLIELVAPHTEEIWIYGLSIEERSDKNWQNLLKILDHNFKDIKEQIEEVVFEKDHYFWIELRKELQELKKKENINLSIHL
jgi:DNA repair photolyase